MHEAGYRRHHQQHDDGKRIDAQRPIDFQIAGSDVVEDGDVGVMSGEADIVKGVARQHPGDGKQRRRDQFGGARAGGRLGAAMFVVGTVRDCGMADLGVRRAMRLLDAIATACSWSGGGGSSPGRRLRAPISAMAPAMTAPRSGRKTMASYMPLCPQFPTATPSAGNASFALPHGEEGGVRGYGLSVRAPSPQPSPRCGEGVRISKPLTR